MIEIALEMSEQYLVAARKYRPQTFDTVVGQSHITTTLKNAIKTQHLAHAYLFCGPRGVGKTTCARILAKTINCEHPTQEMEACGTCNMCKTFNENASFNIFELDAASNNSVDDIRALTEQVRFMPQMGKYKVYIIDEVHMLSTAAFNAFLKTLEEPPSYAIFILATTEKHKILPTILSRCQIFDFKRIQSGDIVNHLDSICAKENIVAENAALHIIAQNSEGCMRDALSMLDRISSFTDGNITYDQAIEHLNILDAGVYFKLLDALLTTNIPDLLLLLDDIYQKGFEGDTVLSGFGQHLRNLLLCKDLKMIKLLDVAASHKNQFFELAQMVSYSYLSSALTIINEAEINYKTTLNKRLQLEVTFIKLCYLPYLTDKTKLEELKKKADLTLPETFSSPEATLSPKEVVAVEHKSNAVEPISQNLIQEPEVTFEQEANQEEEQKSEKLKEVLNAAIKNLNNTDAPIVSKEKEEEDPTHIALPKLGKNFLKNIQSQFENLDTAIEVPELDDSLALSLYTQYVIQLRNEAGKELQATNLSNNKIEVRSPNIVTIVCNTNFSLIYADGNVDNLREFYRKETKNHEILVVTELDQTAINEEENPQRLSKSEMFDQLAQKNPLLLQLKKDLNLDLK
ncbi:MAG TPA: DNA polymerase III subunit gamma/tau [Edaphocola sp.]|nr:DNA polymerase III subunit gamma/tau [Edaphocola sp.]